ncbi:MAG: (deoxy)nucleoside triphosphate pyrophosphohydrolase [Clostridiales bacterium]|nr:(deoxy)nucleoside triphosphate pyrophosphohydrolase [Clostridiales bacterium]
MKKHVKVAAALLFNNGRIFATKRGDSPYPYVAHKYEFPGGKIEEGERGEDAVKRELKEELDLDVTVGGLYASHTFEYPDFIITLFVYECEQCSDFILKEHESYAWIAPKDLKEEEWAPADADILGSLKRVFGE